MSKSIFIVTYFSVFFCSFSFSQEAENSKRISLKEAVEKGYVSMTLKGALDRMIILEVIDKDGIHYGKCMGIILENKTKENYTLTLAAGTELIPFDSTYQTMIVTKQVEFPLPEGCLYVSRFYAMCGEIHDYSPSLESNYSIGNLAEKNIVRLANFFDKNYIQNMVGQHALWAYTDNVGLSELMAYGATVHSLRLSAEILGELKIQTPISSKKKYKIPRDKVASKPAILVYVFSGLSLIFFSTTYYFWFLSKRNSTTPSQF